MPWKAENIPDSRHKEKRVTATSQELVNDHLVLCRPTWYQFCKLTNILEWSMCDSISS